MNHLKLFPTTIGYYLDRELGEEMLEVAKDLLADTNNLTNTWNYRNTYSCDLTANNSVDKFNQRIIGYADNYLDSMGFDSKVMKQYLQVDTFFSEMFEGDRHGKHEHPESQLSGVMYLSTPPNSGRLRLYDPRQYTSFQQWPVKEEHVLNWRYYDIEPEPGLILMWPSWLSHEVLINHSGEGRITAVFNIGYRRL